VFWALFSIYFRKLGNEDPVNVTAQVFIMGTLVLLPASLASGELFNISLSGEFLTYLLASSLVGGALLFLLWNLIVNAHGVSRAVSYIFSIPALTLILDYLILGRVPTPLELVGASTMFLGIYLSNRGRGSRVEVVRSRV
jgi:drug/metabolite transporter (DMT)-like permease